MNCLSLVKTLLLINETLRTSLLSLYRLMDDPLLSRHPFPSFTLHYPAPLQFHWIFYISLFHRYYLISHYRPILTDITFFHSFTDITWFNRYCFLSLFNKGNRQDDQKLSCPRPVGSLPCLTACLAHSPIGFTIPLPAPIIIIYSLIVRETL